MEYITVYSKDRESGGSFNSFSYKLDSQLRKAKKIVPRKVCMHNTQRTVNVYNTTLSYNYNSTAYSITIPQGFYTGDELVTKIQTLLDTESGASNVTISKESLTDIITISSSTDISLDFSESTSVGYTLGFTELTYSLGTSHEAEGIPNMKTEYYRIDVSIVTNTGHEKTGTTNTLAYVIASAPNNCACIEQEHFKIDIPSNFGIQSFDVEVYNSDNVLADIKKDWTMYLAVEY